jgi:predicted GIY-YIG superfamily endonuclease
MYIYALALENNKYYIGKTNNIDNRLNQHQYSHLGSEWTKLHPSFKDSESKENDKYLKIVSESMSGTTEDESKKNYTKIIKNIVKETVIDKTVDTVSRGGLGV